MYICIYIYIFTIHLFYLLISATQAQWFSNAPLAYNTLLHCLLGVADISLRVLSAKPTAKKHTRLKNSKHTHTHRALKKWAQQEISVRHYSSCEPLTESYTWSLMGGNISMSSVCNDSLHITPRPTFDPLVACRSWHYACNKYSAKNIKTFTYVWLKNFAKISDHSNFYLRALRLVACQLVTRVLMSNNNAYKWNISQYGLIM